ncbi:TlpA family protein disulfide reductase [Sphingobacterium paucimobilis]|uniref:Thioredoxin domain-containing protein n=1 Tax=Sphingobacterium paucimobilis HER1398 TaxID=1346330 RepID=U2J8B6_9SPHI|nr:hypothetical protein [Sphingobacterium paucimobilis]ERJ61159.1 hypothetical protein M472_20620 [Sphingobacterium paucimobilis HER1398]
MKNFNGGGRELPKVYTLPMLIFCVLFSAAAVIPAFGQEADGLRIKPNRLVWNYNYTLYDAVIFRPFNHERFYKGALEEYPKADLEKFEIGRYDVDTLKIKQIKIGDKIPDELWDLPLWIVNDYNGRDTTTLRQESDREWLIIDLWADFCGPCIKSMTAWESRFSDQNTNFTLLGNFDTNLTYRAVPSCRRFGYKSTQIIGKSAALLHHLFFWNDRRTGPTLWIKNGQLFGISNAGKLTETEYIDILSGKLAEIPSHAAYIYGSYI